MTDNQEASSLIEVRIPITDEMLEMLFCCRARTKIGSRNLLRITPGPHPEGLSARIIESWLSGRTKTARTDLWHYVLGAWKNAPAAPSVGRNLGPGRVPVTEAMRAELRYLKNATGVGPCALMRQAPQPIPQGLRSHTIQRWIDGLVKTARIEHWQYVLDAWQSLPRQIVITDDMRAQLQTLRASGGMGVTRLLRLAPNPVPPGLKASTVNRWLNGKAKTARADHWHYILDAWKNAPAAPSVERNPGPGRVPVTEAMRAELRYLKDATGVGPRALMRQAPQSIPRGLRSHTIQTWLDGLVKTARIEHWQYVLDAWHSLPRQIVITDDMRAQLQTLRASGGMGVTRLLRLTAKPVPPGLKASTVNRWLNGKAKTACSDHWHYILDAWESLVQSIAARTNSADTPPPSPQKVPAPPPPPRPQRVPVTESIRRRLQEQKERTCLGPSAFITAAGDRPKGLGQASIAGWLSGTAKTARADHLAFVLRRWPELPARIAITEDMRQAMKTERDRTGVTPFNLLKDDAEAPGQLSCGAIANWLSGATATALEHHLDYVLSKWRSLPDGPDGNN